MEIDKELEEDFDLSDERGYLLGYTASNDPMQSTLEDNEQTDTSNYNTENPQMPSESYVESQFDMHEQQTDEDFDDRLRLKIKLGQLYQRYCEAKKRRAKWNELDERVSKSSNLLDERVPSPIAELLRQSREDAKDRHIFQTSRANQSFDEKLKMMTIMSFLRLPDEQRSVAVKKNIKSQPFNEFEEPSQLSFVNTPAEYESKYASQIKLSPKPVASTAQMFASSTPHKLLNDRCKPAAPIHSPIVGGSHANKVENNSRQKRRINKDDPKWYLKYLGLDSISDLFSDDESNEHNVQICDKNQSEDQETQLYNNLNKSICGNESLVEEQSQYTVTRIMKICEDAERERKGGEMKSNSDFVTPRRKRLYIGSVDDLFCDDDEDDNDAYGDHIINSQVVDVALSSSNETINYDVDDALSQHKNAHHSTNLFRDSIEGEASHHMLPNAAVTAVANTKSDELFSTYNETVANSSKMTANSTKNCTTNNHSPQREHNEADESIPATPPKLNSSNIFAYFSRSPSVLIKASSILSTNNQNTTSCLTGKANDLSKSSNSVNSDKSSTSLSFKLSALNSQLVLSKHFDDFDEIKENVDIETNASPFATCQTSRTTYQNRQRSSSPDPSPDTFATCQSIPVKYNILVGNYMNLRN